MADDQVEFERSRVLGLARRSHFAIDAIASPIRDTSNAKFGRSALAVVTTTSPRPTKGVTNEQRLQLRSPLPAPFAASSSASSSFSSSMSLAAPPQASEIAIHADSQYSAVALGYGDDDDDDDGDSGLLRSLIGRKPGHLQSGSSPSPAIPYAAQTMSSSSDVRVGSDRPQRDTTLELADLSSSSAAAVTAAAAADDTISLPPTFAASLAPRPSVSSPKTQSAR